MSLIAAATLSALGATADVEEVGGLAAGALDQVHGRHREPGATVTKNGTDDTVQPLCSGRLRVRYILH